MNSRDPLEEDVLFAYAVEPAHDLATLERYVLRYPQFTQALIDCSIELEHSPSRGGRPKAMASASAEAAWKRFQTAMAQPVEPASNPFAHLNSQAFQALAAELKMNILLLMRLRDRTIRAATIPGQLIRMLAGKLAVRPEEMKGFLNSAPPLAVEGVQFKSAAKPTAAPQIDFAEAVRTSQLTPAQQEHLLALKE
jgi:hypothetical protein